MAPLLARRSLILREQINPILRDNRRSKKCGVIKRIEKETEHCRILLKTGVFCGALLLRYDKTKERKRVGK